MRPIFGDHNWQALKRVRKLPGILPRRTRYGSVEATSIGLTPMGDYPSKLVAVDDFKAVIEECHAKQVFPMYHLEKSGVCGNWNQNGLNYCWAWGITAAITANREKEGQTPVELAPVTLGHLVNWRNTGNYLDSAVQGVRERGIAPLEYCSTMYNRKPSSYQEGWQEAALNFRLSEWWDGDTSGTDLYTLQQCLTSLSCGDPIYIAYYWWSHALTIMGMEWDETQTNNVRVVCFNSHDDGFIELTGNKAVPDEFYMVKSGSLAA